MSSLFLSSVWFSLVLLQVLVLLHSLEKGSVQAFVVIQQQPLNKLNPVSSSSIASLPTMLYYRDVVVQKRPSVISQLVRVTTTTLSSTTSLKSNNRNDENDTTTSSNSTTTTTTTQSAATTTATIDPPNKNNDDNNKNVAFFLSNNDNKNTVTTAAKPKPNNKNNSNNNPFGFNFNINGNSNNKSSNNNNDKNDKDDIATSTTTSTTSNNELLDAFTGAAKQVGSDFFSFLRVNAAQALTKSLPDPERKQLLNRVIPNITEISDDDEIVITTTRSVAEKITSYELEQIKEIDKEMDALRKAEEAALERVKNELAIQQQLLQNYTSLTANNEHPILGKCIIDLGYKRIHSVSAELLASIPVWQKQRTYRHNRAKAMAADKLKTQHFGLPGVIVIHEDITTGKLSILDGQHRVGMMQVLLQQNKTITAATAKVTRPGTISRSTTSKIIPTTTLDLQNILIEVYPTTPSLAQDLFLEVNKAEPVKLIDLPGVVKTKDRKLITDAVTKLELEYSAMFKASQRCYQPHLNIDNVRDNIYASNILARHQLNTTKQLYDWLLYQNDVLALKYNTTEALQKNTVTASEKAITKSNQYKFYLGLESSWLYN